MSNIRKIALVTGETYHIFTRSIAGFEVFRSDNSFERFIRAMNFYNQLEPNQRLSDYLQLSPEAKKTNDSLLESDPLVQIIAYCVMPTHIHLALKQIKDRGISIYMSNTLNSFTRYFNIAHKRRGPLWESKFKNVLVDTDDQLLHLTRYIHLNPCSAGLVSKPEDWIHSSYAEYVSGKTGSEICNWEGLLDILLNDYRKFVNSRVQYQRALSKIKHLLIDNYTG